MIRDVFILKTIKFNKLNSIIVSIFSKFEGGQMYSESLRLATSSKYNVKVGLYSYGSCFSKTFNLGGTVEIGNYCSIAENVRYFGANHPVEALSTSPLFYNNNFGFSVQDIVRHTLVIENDVWIGYGVIIVSSCKKIGQGAVIGAGAIVTKDVPPYAIVVGNPARIVNYRFSDEVIVKIEKSNWWKQPPQQVLHYYKEFDKSNITENRG